jgi:putative membrane protein
MTPLYTTLALFIGCLLIMVVIKPTVSTATQIRLKHPPHWQLFIGRYICVLLVALAQATIMGLGNMLAVKVQVAHPLLLMVCFWVTAVVFSFIIYTLVASFANLGKAIAVLLLIVQVTGCGGSYPLQLLPNFVQTISPFLPATHVVDAMRAAMFGVYNNDFWLSIGSLALFIVPFALVGLVLARPLAKFMRWYIARVEASKLIS